MNLRNHILKECENCNEFDMILRTESLCDACLKEKREQNKNILKI